MIRVTNINEKFIPISKIGDNIKIAFDYEPFYDIDEDGNKTETSLGTWSVHTFHGTKSFDQIKSFIIAELNKQIDFKILNGFTWKNMAVWLSSENQFNYKAAYDLAVQTGGMNLPITFKFGDTYTPIYYTFDNLADFSDFYISAMNYINQCLAEGWAKKDAIDWEQYKL